MCLLLICSYFIASAITLSLENSGKQVVRCFLFVDGSAEVLLQVDAIAKIGLKNFVEQMGGTHVGIHLRGIANAENYIKAR